MRFFILVLFFVFVFKNLLAQYDSPQEQAMQLYSEGKYAEALVTFKKLTTLFPNDPKYFYYSGICMVETNSTLETAIKNLSFAADKAVPRNVYFYLGKAYHFLYRFNEAADCYRKFEQFGLPDEQEKLKLKMYTGMARNGIDIKTRVVISVVARENSNQDGVYVFLNDQLKNGKFVSRSGGLLGNHNTLSDWRYEPTFRENGVLTFGSSTKGILKGNNDIYYSKYNGKSWGKMQFLPDKINTPYNEDFVWFNESEPALYFSSQGFNSIGGYDIFKSVYNPDLKTWSDPVNLGYPINSPYNDFLFIVDDNQEYAWFVSDRETQGDELMCYKIKFSKEFNKEALPNNFAFTNTLNVNSGATPGKDLKNLYASEVKKPELKLKPEVQPDVKTDSKTSVKVNTQHEVEYPKELMDSKSYNQLLSDALTFQLKTDSLGMLIEDYREKISNSGNENERNALKTKMFQADKMSKIYQAKADSLYVKARTYETGSKTQPNTDKKDMDKLARQAFSETKKENAGNKAKTPEKKNTAIVYEFKVMSKSPYKTVDEIPINQPLPDGIIYRVQMGAFSKVIEPDRFKGIVPISGETVGSTGITKYFAGLFSRLTDSEKALVKIKEYGFADAYVVAFYNGKPIPINRAREIENGYN